MKPDLAETIRQIEASASEYRRARPDRLNPKHFAELLDGIADRLRNLSA